MPDMNQQMHLPLEGMKRSMIVEARLLYHFPRRKTVTCYLPADDHLHC